MMFSGDGNRDMRTRQAHKKAAFADQRAKIGAMRPGGETGVGTPGGGQMFSQSPLTQSLEQPLTGMTQSMPTFSGAQLSAAPDLSAPNALGRNMGALGRNMGADNPLNALLQQLMLLFGRR